MSSYIPDTAYDHHLPYGNRRTARNDVLHPRSNPGRRSPFVDRYTDDFQMPLHFDQYNPATWPAEYVKHQAERARGVHTYGQQPPNLNKNAHAPGRAHHGGRDVILPVSGRGNESSISARHRSPVSGPSAKVVIPQGSRTAREDEVDNESPTMWLSVLGYVIVPQDAFVGSAGGSIIPSIDFTPRSKRSYYELGIDIDSARTTHSIKNPEDKVFSQMPGIDTILIKILWPGYPKNYYEGKIDNVRNLGRGELLNLVCGVVIGFVKSLKAKPVKVDKWYAEWMIGRTGLKTHKFYVARLHHRGGNYFQPEILVAGPRED